MQISRPLAAWKPIWSMAMPACGMPIAQGRRWPQKGADYYCGKELLRAVHSNSTRALHRLIANAGSVDGAGRGGGALSLDRPDFAACSHCCSAARGTGLAVPTGAFGYRLRDGSGNRHSASRGSAAGAFWFDVSRVKNRGRAFGGLRSCIDRRAQIAERKYCAGSSPISWPRPKPTGKPNWYVCSNA